MQVRYIGLARDLWGRNISADRGDEGVASEQAKMLVCSTYFCTWADDVYHLKRLM